MKISFALILLLLVTGAAAAQRSAAGDDDKKALEAAVNAPLNADKAALLEKFVTERPKSQYLQSARESLVVARAAYGEELLRSGRRDESLELFRRSITDAPEPIPDKLFDGAISRFPSVLYWAGERRFAVELAETIEKKVSGNAGQLRSLAMFYLSIENGSRAKDLAEAAIAVDPGSSASYETLGLAERIDFDFEAAVAAYRKAVEVDPANTAAKLSLAEMLRAQSKPAEATEIYKAILAETPDDAAASAGLVLSLFDEGKRDEAETLFAEVTAADDKNFQLLAGVAYWYAANGEGVKAQEIAEKALALEPRFIWSHIALGKALTAQGDPVGAEKVLLAARRYANIPTLEFEIAAARYKAGFYREAAEELSKSFEIEDGRISTLLGRRIERGSESFADLVGYERRASLFEPLAAVSGEDDARIKALFSMMRTVDYGGTAEQAAAEADKFAAGDDQMNLYRKLFAADVLLDKTDDAAKAAAFAADAIGKTDAALEAPSAGSAVMAGELYESRTLAEARGEFLIVPDVPKSTLSAILRGRVEDLAGRALHKQKKYDEAVVRYRRAMTVLPPDSAWWRATLWHLGESLQAQGKGRDALEAYVKSYKSDKPNVVKYGVVAALYEQMNGSRNGLETLIGENPLGPSETEVSETEQTPSATPTPEQKIPAFIPSKVPVAENAAEPNESTEARAEEPAADGSETAMNFRDVLRRTETLTAAEPETAEPATKADDESVATPQTETAASIDVPVATDEAPTTEPENKAEETAANADAAPTNPQEVLPAETAAIETQTATIETPAESTQNAAAEPESSPTEADGAKADESPADKKADSPFEPVVIVVGKTTAPEAKPKADDVTPADTEQNDAVNDEIADQTPDESTPNEEIREKAEGETSPTISERPNDPETENRLTKAEPATGTGNSSDDRAADENSATPPATEGTRKRVVDGVAINEKTGNTCEVYSSQDSVSILNDGGNIGILIGIEGVASKDIRVENSSPENIGVSLQPDITGFDGRAFFVVRSKTTQTGLFQVTFAGDCGSKTIPVTVR